MTDMTPYDYTPVKHWWDEPAKHPAAFLVRAHGRLYLAASSVGAGLSTFLYWRDHAIPRRYWVAFERQGVSRAALTAHEKQYKRHQMMTVREYQRYYYLTKTLPKRRAAQIAPRKAVKP